MQFWTKTSVHAQDSLINNGADGHEIETSAKLIPKSHSVSSLAFIIETVRSVNCLAFVVASQKIERVGILDLEGKQ